MKDCMVISRLIALTFFSLSDLTTFHLKSTRLRDLRIVGCEVSSREVSVLRQQTEVMHYPVQCQAKCLNTNRTF